MQLHLVAFALFLSEGSGFILAPPQWRPLQTPSKHGHSMLTTVPRWPHRSSPRCHRAVTCTISGPQAQATLAASILGLTSQPIMWWSLYTLKTTGCGLPAGPFGLIGAAEGISYLVVIGFCAASALTKATSGSGLPPGPGGLLGAAEGLSFMTALAGLAVLGFQLSDYGYLPEAVPVEGGVCSHLG